MARGWESKSVEEQQAESKLEHSGKKVRLTPEQIVNERRKQGLILSRSSVVRQLQTVKSEAHRQMLERALADLEAQIARLG